MECSTGAPGTYYGMASWRAWNESRPRDLSRTMRLGTKVAGEEPCPVTSYSELHKVVSFLNVMNKKCHLLFRGQSIDVLPTPSLLRNTWTPPREARTGPVALDQDDGHYLEQLDRAGRQVAQILRSDRLLPRWRPFVFEDGGLLRHPERHLAAWAVVQHYGIWPTPLLDLTSSLRVAASFALGLEDDKRRWWQRVGKVGWRKRGECQGHLYVFAIPQLLSDFMDLENYPLTEMHALRLNAVCPPDAVRPHFQDGFLLTWPLKGRRPDREASVARKLVAKFRLIDTGDFWTDDFPRHTRASLLPERERDALLRTFRQRITYRLEGHRLTIKPVDGS